jgi:spore germination cell wall hydrolase CwlJ-like protein
MKKLLLSLLVVGSTVVQAAEFKQEQIVLADNTTFSSQLIEQTTSFVERTVNLIATPFLSDKDVECMARNIFYEAGAESKEGKIAVAQVTLNRAQDPRFGRSVCEVVKARTTVIRTKEVTRTEIVKRGYFGRPEQVTRKEMLSQPVTICQFSWMCSSVRAPKSTDTAWVESQEIAKEIASGGHQQERAKYSTAMYFHAAGIRPVWAKSKAYVKRTGQHLFYAEVDK